MREKLKAIEGTRAWFEATFARFGEKPAFKGPPVKTALFLDLKDWRGRVLTDHFWWTVGKQVAELSLKPGDRIAFQARVTRYRKGYRGRREDDDDLPPPEVDYRVSHMTRVRRLAPEVEGDDAVKPITHAEQPGLFE
jgi:hypothetical protein